MPPLGKSILVTILLSATGAAAETRWDGHLADARGSVTSGVARASAAQPVHNSTRLTHRAGAPSPHARLPIEIVQSPRTESSTVPSPAGDERSPLPPPKRSRSTEGSRSFGPSTGNAVTTVITSLAVVLGLFAIVVWFARRANPKGYASLPGEVVETLGRAPLSGRQEMHLVRVGKKLLLLSVTQTGAETLTEITDPAEIDRLAGICQQNHPGSVTASFREVFAQMGK